MEALKRGFAILLLLGSVLSLHAQEICDNGIDDDADGLVDLNDTTDCDGFVIDGLSYILPNRDFETYDCIPQSYTELYCADTWSQATEGTSDYFRVEGFFPTFIPQPLSSGGSGCVGGYVCPDYKEYVGGCLNAPLEEGNSYVLRLAITAVLADNHSLISSIPLDLPPTNLTVWGLGTCPVWPIPTMDCPEGLGWTIVGEVEYSPTEQWQEVEVELWPWEDIHAIMIGGPCEPVGYPPVAEPYIAYFLYDDLSGSEIAPGMAGIDATGALCTGDLRIQAYPESETAPLQWYRNGVALVGETTDVLDVSAFGTGAGTYGCRVDVGAGHVIANYHVDDPNSVVPEVVQFGAGLLCTTPGFHQWSMDGYELIGATSSYYEPTQAGSYTVRVTSGEGCSATSAAFVVNALGLPVFAADRPIVYHAPGTTFLEVVNAPAAATLDVLDMTGRLVLQAQAPGTRWSMDIAQLPEGVYSAVLAGKVFRFVR